MHSSINLKRFREKRVITQKTLAEKAGTTPTTISAYEKGIKNPSLDTAISIAKVLDISLDKLCGILPDESAFVNYGDVIKSMMEISEKVRITIGFNEEENIGSMTFEDHYIGSFLNNWSKIKEMYENNVINTDLYFAWVEKQLRDYSKTLLPEQII